MRSTRLLSLALVAALALGLAACGGSDDASPSKEDFVKQANAICKEGDDKIGKLEQGSGEDGQNAYVVEAATISLAEISDIHDLGFPSGDSDELDKALSAIEQAFESVKDDPSKVTTLGSDTALAEATATMTDYGLDDCGGGS